MLVNLQSYSYTNNKSTFILVLSKRRNSPCPTALFGWSHWVCDWTLWQLGRGHTPFSFGLPYLQFPGARKTWQVYRFTRSFWAVSAASGRLASSLARSLAIYIHIYGSLVWGCSCCVGLLFRNVGALSSEMRCPVIRSFLPRSDVVSVVWVSAPCYGKEWNNKLLSKHMFIQRQFPGP